MAHATKPDALLQKFNATAEGLTGEEAQRRLQEQGYNELAPPAAPGLLRRLMGQLTDPMILLLLASAGISLWAGGGESLLDGIIILIIVGVNSVLSLVQEDHAQKALEELRRLSAPKARVLRDGEVKLVPARELVTGDVMELEAGDYVPADGRLLSCVCLRVDESAMTGESVPAEKQVRDTLPAETPLAERVNMVLSGTLVTAGRGRALVTATGMDTGMGKVAGLLLGEGEQQSPLQRRMAEVSKKLSALCMGVCVVVFTLGIARGKGAAEMLMTAVSLAVAAIPEGLPAIVTIVLSMGVQRLARRGAIIKKLPCVETLGCAEVICSDKTGTLTQNKMTVQQLWTLPDQRRDEVFRCAALCSDSRLRWEGKTPLCEGDPTENALVLAAAKAGLDKNELEKTFPRRGEIPFDSERKLMSTLHPEPGGGWTLVTKGAPDVLLSRCRGLSVGERKRIETANADMARAALRVIAVGRRHLDILPREGEWSVLEGELTFLGLFGLVDPPRPGAEDAVAKCSDAGIRTVLITGDHKLTAVAVAKELGILKKGQRAITGAELDFMSDDLLTEEVEGFSVYARVTPEHKLRIVKAWQKRGKTVAMSGDGVNDAPALKRADIGCAMGRSGTDVAKGAAHMILTDDDFSTIVAAVEEGRGIYANIRKAIHYLLSCNIGEIITIFAATLLDFPEMPLAPVQLLWLNLVTDSLPALALGVERVEEDVMKRPPRRGDAPLFDRAFTLRLVWQGLMVGGLTLTAYLLGARTGLAQGSTMAFATLTLCQLVHAFNVRSEDRSLTECGFFSNPAMNRAFLIGLALQLAVLLLPPLQGVFRVVPLTWRQWMAVVALAAAPIPICEVMKGMNR